MVSFTAVKVGDVLYQRKRVKQGNTTLTKVIYYTVRITEVHNDYVMASWNGNAPERFYDGAVSKMSRSKPAK